MWDRDTKTLAGFCGGILALIALAVFLRDVIGHGDPALWANIIVAAGTTLLAVATFWSVSRTNAVIRGEERRHQQQFGPLLCLRFSPSNGSVQGALTMNAGFAASNIGNGIALNIRVRVVTDVSYLVQLYSVKGYSADEISDIAKSHNGASFQSVGPLNHLITSERNSFACSFEYAASAIPTKEYELFYEKRVADLDKPKPIFLEARVDYQDMFGNHYATIYEPGPDLELYQWIQPVTLRSPSM